MRKSGLGYAACAEIDELNKPLGTENVRIQSRVREWKKKMGVQQHPQECVSVVQLDGILRMVYKNVTNAFLASLRNQPILLVVQVVQSDFMVI